MKKVEIEIKGLRCLGAVAQSGTTTWFSLNGEVWTVESESGTGSRGRRSSTKEMSGGGGKIAAPMPGKIIKVLVKAGDRVIGGETLIVMEAMKMEYTLKAAADGLVESVACGPGEQVVLGAVLVQMKIDTVAGQAVSQESNRETKK